jgi:hypothetical protein
MRERQVVACDWCSGKEIDYSGAGVPEWFVLKRNGGNLRSGVIFEEVNADLCSTACALEWLKAPAKERKVHAKNPEDLRSL